VALISATVRNENTLEAFVNACGKSSALQNQIAIIYRLCQELTHGHVSETKKFYMQDVDFHTPPMDQQTGFFHPMTTKIRILCITRPRAAKELNPP